MKYTSLLLLSLCIGFLPLTSAVAEEEVKVEGIETPEASLAAEAVNPFQVTVTHQDTSEERSIILDPGERAFISIYLMSHGEMVNAYRLSLVRLPEDKVVETGDTNIHGIVNFKGVPPGRYHILMWKARRNSLHRVRIGDMTVKKEVSADPEAISEAETAQAEAAAAAAAEEEADAEAEERVSSEATSTAPPKKSSRGAKQ